jgi:hypothetical protein
MTVKYLAPCLEQTPRLATGEKGPIRSSQCARTIWEAKEETSGGAACGERRSFDTEVRSACVTPLRNRDEHFGDSSFRIETELWYRVRKRSDARSTMTGALSLKHQLRRASASVFCFSLLLLSLAPLPSSQLDTNFFCFFISTASRTTKAKSTALTMTGRELPSIPSRRSTRPS